MEELRNEALAECARFDDELGEYLEGEARPFVSAHSQDCALCGAVLADLIALSAAARNLPLEEPSSTLWNRIRSAHQAEGGFAVPACSIFDTELEVYLDGEARPFVVEHARECVPCGAILADMQTIQQAAKDLPLLEPSPALWANIRASLNSEKAVAAAACLQFEEALPAYLEGEANALVHAHARECVPCGAMLADLEAIQVAANELPQIEPSPVLWANIQASLREEKAVSIAACSQFEEGLQEYLEGVASPLVAAHASECVPCGAMLADLQAIQRAAQELPLAEPSPVLWANVHARLQAEGLVALPACGQFDEGLEAYLEGEASPFIVEHAAQCVPCGAMLADLQAIQLAAKDLPQPEPSRAVWANVRAQLEAEGVIKTQAGFWQKMRAWGLQPNAVPLAVLSALLVLGALLTLPWEKGLRSTDADRVIPSQPTVQMASLESVDDGGLAKVVSGLESNYQASGSSISPDLKATYDKSLVSLNGSIRECLDSLKREPRNTLAHDYLLAAYTRKAEVLSSALEFQGR